MTTATQCKHNPDRVMVDANGVYCPDCGNEQMTVSQAESIMHAYEASEQAVFDESDELRGR